MSQKSSNQPLPLTSISSVIKLSQILPFLYVGCQDDVLSHKTMKDNNITHVINVSRNGECAPFINENDTEHFLRIPINDSLNAQIFPYFDKVYSFIEKARRNNGHVFIHCLAGISRSPTLAIAYIMRYLHLTADDAYKYVQQRRPEIAPNFNFLGQLSEYERQLSLTPIDVPIVKCIKVETPFNDHCRCVQVEGRCNEENFTKDRRKTSSNSPKCFSLDLKRTPKRPETLSIPSSTNVTNHQSIEICKLERPKSISIKQSFETVECPTVELLNSSADELTHSKQNDKLAKSADNSSRIEQTDLINTYFHDSSNETSSTNVLNTSLEVLVL